MSAPRHFALARGRDSLYFTADTTQSYPLTAYVQIIRQPEPAPHPWYLSTPVLVTGCLLLLVMAVWLLERLRRVETIAMRGSGFEMDDRGVQWRDATRRE